MVYFKGRCLNLEEFRFWMEIALLIVLIGLSAFFSASETALTSFRRVYIGEIIDKKKVKLLKEWLAKPNEYLTTILLGNNIVNVGATTIATIITFGVVQKLGLNRGIAGLLVTVVMTALLLIFGEITPKVIAKNYSIQISKAVIVPINTLKKLSKFIVVVFISISKFFSRLFNVPINDDMFLITEDSIKTYVVQGKEDGAIEEEEQEMIHSIIDFTDTSAKEILTPRTSIFALEGNKCLDEVWDSIIDQGFSRIPIYEEQIDNVVGILYSKDLLKFDRTRDKDVKVSELKRDAYFIPGTKTLIELLEEFREKQNHMAIVIDEYGGTLGLVTIEDLLEEIVGEIRDEYDFEEENINQIKDEVFDIKGDTEIETVNKELDINIPISDEYDTIAGYVHYELGKVAEVNDKVNGEDYVIRVLHLDSHRIDKVRIIKLVTEINEEDN